MSCAIRKTLLNTSENIIIQIMMNGTIICNNLQINLPANNYWTDIAYGNKLYIAISSANEWLKPRFITSIDGINWKLHRFYNNIRKYCAEDGNEYMCETYDFAWKSITYYKKLQIFIVKDKFENILWIDSKTLKPKLFKYQFKYLNKCAEKSIKRKTYEKSIEEKIIFISYGIY
jgi:hypothetical protein